jgi:putative PIN family toxin of toxin-antitoxin system
MRIVLDTNILARAASPSAGPAREVLMRSATAPHVLVLSAFILSELSRVLRYPRVQAMHGLDDARIDRFVADVEAAGVTVLLPLSLRPVVLHDADDDPILATAVFGHAEVLCTRDRHLQHAVVRAQADTHGIRIMGDTDLLALLRQSDARS